MALLVPYPLRLVESAWAREEGLLRCVRVLLGYPLRGIRRYVVSAVIASLIVGCVPAKAQAPVFKENSVKAVFLLNFARFVEWPPNAFASFGSPFVIGVLGDDPFGRALEAAVSREAIGGHKLIMERYRRVEEIRSCHILFIGETESGRYGQIFAGLAGRMILTVGDNDSFARRGGMIQFVTEAGRIRLRINLNAARAAKLTISSKLLRQAEIADARRG